jgi:MYXO-CTERM domain-containing protein
MMTFASSDAQFSLATSQATTGAKSTYDLVVRFAPNGPGEASAEITVKSNDPDSPVQTFKVTATAQDKPVPAPSENGSPEEPPVPASAGNDSGCGCRVVSRPGSSGALAFFGLGLAALLRRRRR